MNTILENSETDDRRLIELHLAGDPTAFRRIVERYQGMVCALAYSACGDLARSEDVAQEVFISAWRQLPQLREREKLRGWLGGIVRNLAHNALRRAPRIPAARAEELSAESPAEAADPRTEAIGADEAALMWGALAGLPGNYREPMVLFYREHRSMAAVAEALEISEETARQRLARGRAMLSERMAKLVEDALGRSAPTPAFAGVVLLALPKALAPLVAEATLGGGGGAKAAPAIGGVAAAAKGGLALKLLAAFAALPTLMNGLTEYLRFRAHLASPAARDRDEIVRLHLLPQLLNATLLGGMALVLWVPVPGNWKALALVPFALGVVVAARYDQRRRRIAAADLARTPAPAFEYRSAGGFLGLPWVHVRAGGAWRGRKAAGWVAISDGVAIGGLFASAPLAVAPVGVGGIAVGLLTLGGLALGLAALGVFAGGAWAVGGMALGTQAAQGGLAFAGEFAAGVHAAAAHANDAVAREFFQKHVFFQLSRWAWRVAVWAAFFGWLPPLVLMSWQLRRNRRPAA